MNNSQLTNTTSATTNTSATAYTEPTESRLQFLSEAEIDAEIQRLQEKELTLQNNNQRLSNQMNDLRELMRMVDNRHDQDAKQLLNRNKDLEKEIKSLKQALEVQENHGHHLSDMAEFWHQDKRKE
eukprot:403362774